MTRDEWNSREYDPPRSIGDDTDRLPVVFVKLCVELDALDPRSYADPDRMVFTGEELADAIDRIIGGESPRDAADRLTRNKAPVCPA